MRRSFPAGTTSNPLPPLLLQIQRQKPGCTACHHVAWCTASMTCTCLCCLACVSVWMCRLCWACVWFVPSSLQRIHSTLTQPRSPFACLSRAFRPYRANFFTLFFSFLLQVLLLRIPSLLLAMLPIQTKQTKENNEDTRNIRSRIARSPRCFACYHQGWDLWKTPLASVWEGDWSHERNRCIQAQQTCNQVRHYETKNKTLWLGFRTNRHVWRRSQLCLGASRAS